MSAKLTNSLNVLQDPQIQHVALFRLWYHYWGQVTGEEESFCYKQSRGEG